VKQDEQSEERHIDPSQRPTMTTGAPSLAQEGRDAVAWRGAWGWLPPHSSSERHRNDDSDDDRRASQCNDDERQTTPEDAERWENELADGTGPYEITSGGGCQRC
jgi:hypothetical protein